MFREDLGQAVDVEALEGLSGKKQRAHLNAIKEACQRYITSTLKTRLTASIASAFEKAGLPFNPSTVTLDPDDPDQQTLLIAYPAVSAQPGDYNPPTVKIEAGAKSALDPHRATRVTPYLAEDVPNLMLNVANVVTINAERTFWAEKHDVPSRVSSVPNALFTIESNKKTWNRIEIQGVSNIGR